MSAQDRELIALMFGVLLGFAAGALMVLVWFGSLPVPPARVCDPAPVWCVNPGCDVATVAPW